MNLESLPNELLICIFKYFNSIQLLRSFHNINIRFNKLLDFHLDFQGITKHDFDYICHEKLPSTIDQITSFRLSDHYDTPEQPFLFYSYGFTLQQMINLKSLSLYYICSTELLLILTIDLNNLIYLKISKSYFNNDTNDMLEVCMSNIWSLPKLQTCHLEIIGDRGYFIPLPFIVSQTIRSLTLENNLISIANFSALIQLTPKLEILSIQCEQSSKFQSLSFPILLITKLTISIKSPFKILKNLFENLPNLSYLMIQTIQTYIDGYQWEEIIINHLKNLKTFRLMMNFVMDNIDQQIDTILQTFQTKFWLEDHQWFVRCDYNIEYGRGHLYILPNKFPRLIYYDPQFYKTTCLDKKKICSFDYIDDFDFSSENWPSDISIQFPNISHLEICFPFDKIFWTIFPSLNRLKSVELLSLADEMKDCHFNQLHQFFDQATELYSLNTDDELFEILSSLKIRSKSIRHLNLQTIHDYYYGSEVIPLIHSILNTQCEVIFINVKKRTVIIEIIQAMPKLQAMNIVCQDDKFSKEEEDDDELVHWLKQRLPSTCSIVRESEHLSTLRLWIR